MEKGYGAGKRGLECVSVALSFRLSKCLSVCRSVCLFACRNVSLSVAVSVFSPVEMSLCLSLWLSISPRSVALVVYLSSVCRSVCSTLAVKGLYRGGKNWCSPPCPPRSPGILLQFPVARSLGVDCDTR